MNVLVWELQRVQRVIAQGIGHHAHAILEAKLVFEELPLEERRLMILLEELPLEKR